MPLSAVVAGPSRNPDKNCHGNPTAGSSPSGDSAHEAGADGKAGICHTAAAACPGPEELHDQPTAPRRIRGVATRAAASE